MDLVKFYRLLKKVILRGKGKKEKNSFKGKITNIPEHVAIIMDGNGRWAKAQGKPRIYGHSHGVDRIRPIIEVATRIGIKCISFYAFSKENWNRPKGEVDFLMKLLENYLNNEQETFLNSRSLLKVIGDISMLSEDIQCKIRTFEELLKEKIKEPKIMVNLAVSYGGKDEIVRSVNRCISREIEKKDKNIFITEDMIEANLDNPWYPKIDLMIRTSGEERISNFMLWQLAYSELYFSEVLWPDFSEEDFIKAIEIYSRRNRRFGTL